jgi:hypothetical protein
LEDCHESGVFQFPQLAQSDAVPHEQAQIVEERRDATANQETKVQRKEDAVTINSHARRLLLLQPSLYSCCSFVVVAV